MKLDRPLILVIEDEILVRAILIAQLFDGGFNAVEAGNARDAEYMLATYPQIEIVIGDAVISDQTDGLDFITEHWPDKKMIVAFDAGTDPSCDLPKAVRSIGKPYAFAELSDRLNEMLTADWPRRRAG